MHLILKNLTSFYSWQKFKFGFTLTLQWNSKSICIQWNLVKKLIFLQECIEKYSGIKDYVQYIWLPIFLKLSGPKPDPVLSKPLLSGHLLSNRHLPRSIHIYFFV